MGRNKFDDRIHLRDTESSSIFRSFVFLEHINELLSCDLEYSLSVHSFGICTTAGKKHTIGEKFATWIGSHTITELNAYVRCECFFHKAPKFETNIEWHSVNMRETRTHANIARVVLMFHSKSISKSLGMKFN